MTRVITADEAALLRGVVVAPDNDLPRLVFADWLQEHGQEDRAEFIRADVEISRLRFASGLADGRVCAHNRWELHTHTDCAFCLLERHRDILLGGVGPAWWTSAPVPNRERWSRPLSDHLASNGGVAFERGFVATLWTQSYQYLVRGVASRVARSAPVEEVWCADKDPAAFFDGRLSVPETATESQPHVWWSRAEPPGMTFAPRVGPDDRRLSRLPPAVFRCLPGGDVITGLRGDARVYRDRRTARLAAARAFARLGRQRAKLPAWGRLREDPT